MTTNPDPVEVLEWADSELAPFAYKAAIQWCGEKERETFKSDVDYFLHQWRWAKGFRARVVAVATAQIAKGQDDAE